MSAWLQIPPITKNYNLKCRVLVMIDRNFNSPFICLVSGEVRLSKRLKKTQNII